jgi:hypothetical protein
MSELGKHIHDMLEKSKARQRQDAERYANLDHDECQLCGVHGEDKRSLTVECFYAVHEAIPEAIDLFLVNESDPSSGPLPDDQGSKQGYYLRICKECRGRFLGHLKTWAEESRAKRGKPMDHDGHIQESNEEANIPIREFGAIRYVTQSEWKTMVEQEK